MSMYTVCGRVFVTRDELYHGLGKGSGRGRPKGSRNGYVDPRAAYMKGYDPVGQKAQAQSETGRGNSVSRTNMSTSSTSRRSASSTGVSDGRGGRAHDISNAPRRASAAPGGGRASASTSVNRGKGFLAKVGGDISSEGRNSQSTGKSYDMHADPYEGEGNATEGSQKEGLLQTIGRWFQGAAQRVQRTAVSSIDAGKRAFQSAKNWVTNAVSDVGKFAKTAYDAAAKFVGDRARDLDRWWNGYDINDSRVQDEMQAGPKHVNGARENISNAAQQAGNWVNQNVATPVANAAGQAREWAQGNVIQPAVNAAQQAGNWVDQNVVQPVGAAANTAQEWVDNNVVIPAGEAFNNARIGAENFFNETVPNAYNSAVQQVSQIPNRANMMINGYDINDPRVQDEMQAGPKHVNGVRDNISNAAQQAGNWANQNIAQPAGRLLNQGVQAVDQAVVQPAGRLWNQGVQAVDQSVVQPAQQAIAAAQARQASVLNSSYAQSAIAQGASSFMVNDIANRYALGRISEEQAIEELRNLKGSPAW